MFYKHYFLCENCKKHIITVTEWDTPWIGASFHRDALKNGAIAAASNETGGETCPGRVTYCSGYDVKAGRNCAPGHRGSQQIHIRPKPTGNADWEAFCGRVTAAWDAFVQSGYSSAARGANNHREYKPTPGVLRVLQGAQGAVNVNDAIYTISNSLTAGVSLHRSIPAQYQRGNMKSFIYHL